MARGNQREKAREKATKKGKGAVQKASDQEANKGMSKEVRQQRDADRMREKQKLAADKKAGEGASGGK